MDSVLGQVEDRDLVDAERSLLTACQQRIAELDAQIEPWPRMRECERRTPPPWPPCPGPIR